MSFRRSIFTILAFGFAAAGASAAPPVVDDPVPVEGGGLPTRVDPRVPIGKALIIPITATDADGEVLQYSVKSSNPAVFVRVRTGLPKLIMNVAHAVGSGIAGDPEFSGTMEFALFRDFTPITADTIAGFADGHFYDGQIFHRIANLNPDELPNGSFIFQGGDPLGTGSGGPGFQYANEFEPALIFAGRGQLAMANSGSNPTTFRGTNGSQFFVTDGHPRFLDFNHTIFGQLLRGWELLPQLRTVPRSASDKPTQDVRMVSARVAPDFSDAILTVSAIAAGTSTITITVEDGTSAAVVKTFVVTAFEDDRNSPPFLRPIEPQVAAMDKVAEVPLRAVDLERDFIFYSNRVVAGSGQSNQSGNPALALGTTGYTGLLTLGVSVSEYDMTYRGSIDGSPAGAEDMAPADIGIGDRALGAEAMSFRATPGELLTGQVVATFTDSDPRGNASTTTATIRWGDGSTPASSAGVIERDSSRPGIARFAVTGSHTYENPGVYPLTVDLQSSGGAKHTVRGQVVVTTGPVAAFGMEINADGKKARVSQVATFTDMEPGRPKNYDAVIAWGDGEVSKGVVKRDKGGGFKVIGDHKYLDSKEFAIAVRIRKNDNAATEIVARSRVRVTGFASEPHLPPFSFSHVIGQFGQTTDASSNTPKKLRETQGNQTFVIGELVVLNSGDRKSPAGGMQFYLSADSELNLTPRQIEDPRHPGQMITTPADRLVTIGGMSNGNLQALKPGEGVRYVFDKSANGDRRLRLPLGENGSSFNLLVVLTYNDPLAKALPISRAVVFGPFNGFIVKPDSLIVREADATEMTKTFTVKMDRAPVANVEVAVTASDSTQVDVSPAKLTFTPTNYSIEHTVTVTAKDDNTADGVKSVRVTLAPAVSDDVQWNGIDPDDVNVSVLDKVATP